jgi:hypothetical protein
MITNKLHIIVVWKCKRFEQESWKVRWFQLTINLNCSYLKKRVLLHRLDMYLLLFCSLIFKYNPCSESFTRYELYCHTALIDYANNKRTRSGERYFKTRTSSVSVSIVSLLVFWFTNLKILISSDPRL